MSNVVSSVIRPNSNQSSPQIISTSTSKSISSTTTTTSPVKTAAATRNRSGSLVNNNNNNSNGVNEYSGKRNGTPAGFYTNGGDSLSRLSPEGKDAELMGEDNGKNDSIPAEVFSTSSNENGKINVQVTVLFGEYRIFMILFLEI